MSTSFSTLIISVIGVSLVHSVMPQHWLPFVLVGRRQHWQRQKLMAWLGLGAMAHMLSTITIGMVMGFVGHTLDARFERLHGLVPGLILIAFGAGYFLSHFHKHIEISDRVAGSTLVIMLALSPCVAVAPFFLIVGPMGLKTLIVMAAFMAVASVAAMVLLGWLASRGISRVRIEWLEHNESRVMGTLLVVLGISFLVLH